MIGVFILIVSVAIVCEKLSENRIKKPIRSEYKVQITGTEYAGSNDEEKNKDENCEKLASRSVK